ncbi:transglycosylase domain-containing protein [Tenggerimyces flavus]|uniref:Transglycosylase domain-containing protein n=1 Tax=Tenggerimyces flavus TaxID=1708749 RepID=A0ABV7YHF4_9ACTN|nr:transglycosylase domain-containing protein [Tenggerimyces flavus]MBM7784688.1 membrane peptidoglycan carboxypeptidase [Tenggerimyces flavus]
MGRVRRRDERGVVTQLFMFLVVSGVAGVLVAGLVIPLAGMTGMSTQAAIDNFEKLPSTLKEPPLPERSTMYDSKGNVLATFYDENRINVSLDKISKPMQQAIVAVEDARFYEHGPLDLRGTMRALIRNQQGSGMQQGGSSITQQYVKLVLFESASTPAEQKAAIDETYERKLQELRFAVGLEEKYSKDQILEKYLNIVFFGANIYGVEAAAKHFFNTTADKLTVPQAAMLAGMVRNPNGFSVEKDPLEVVARRNFVLSRMVDQKSITVADYERLSKQGLGLDISETKTGCFSSKYPFFCEYAVETLLDDPALGATRELRRRYLYEGRLEIRTTLDPKAQDAAQKSIRKKIRPTDPVFSAVSMVEPGTGHIKAMAQSKGYGRGDGNTFVNYNVGQNDGGGIGVQPGSTFKPFVLAAAIKQGIPLSHQVSSPNSMVLPAREPISRCDGSRPWRDDDPWRIGNSSNPGASSIDLIRATTRSVNTAFVNLERETGLCDPWRIATEAGIKRGDGKPLEQVGSFVLGVNEVTPLSMAEAYATFAARGVHCRAIAVTSVLDRKGKAVPVKAAGCKRVLEEHVADAVNYTLRQVVDGNDPSRSGKDMAMEGRQVAGKTGTNNDRKAVSFAGYTTDLATYAVVQDAHSPLRGLRGQRVGGKRLADAEVWGGKLSGPIWLGAMEGALDGKSSPDFEDPEDVVVEGEQSDVPWVLGYSERTATRMLREAGFEVTVGEPVSSSREEGTVAAQSPSGGSEYGTGSTVEIRLSRGDGNGDGDGDGNGDGDGDGNGDSGGDGDGDGDGDGNGNGGGD